MDRHPASRPLRLAAGMLLLLSGGAHGASAGDVPENRLRAERRAVAGAALDRLGAIQSRHAPALLALPGVTGIGIGLDDAGGGLVFLVGVDPSADVAAIPASLEGVPVRLDAQAPLRLLHGGDQCIPCHADERPSGLVEMGNSLEVDSGIPGTCTLGFLACDRTRERLVVVTNSHCATNDAGCPGGAPIGTPVLHPDVAGFEIGRVSGHASLCADGTLVDATAIDTSPYVVSLEMRDVGFPSLAPGTVLPGDQVQKSGRTTGRTFGEVLAVGFITRQVVTPCCLARLSGQILIRTADGPFALAGDSGSAVLTRTEPPAVVGLLFAVNDEAGRTAVANPVAEVLRALDLVDLEECLCAAETLMIGVEPKAADARLAMLRDLRDQGLERTAYGRALRERFERFSGEVGVMLLRNRLLRSRARRVLDRFTPVLADVTAGRAVVVKERELRRVDRLLRAFTHVGGKTLAAELTGFRGELRDPKLQALFGVTVKPVKGGKPAVPGPF